MTSRFSRQSFLGPDSQLQISSFRIGIVGLGGGGSHIAQQLAHIGFLDYVLYDEQRIEESNLNRLVGATENDVEHAELKVNIAKRVINEVRRKANVNSIAKGWQDEPEALRTCDVIFGCIDGFSERLQLEATCRRYLIPYIDIGMDVFIVNDEPPRVVGQVILSLPGLPCMQCLGFLNEQALAREAAAYGAAGSRPQVVWSNGVLASMAVGIAVDLVTGWSRSKPAPVYLSYDGNAGTVAPHVRLRYVENDDCQHFHYGQTGDPIL